MNIRDNGYWAFYESSKEYILDPNKSGKWMCFYKSLGHDYTFGEIEGICKKSVAENIVKTCKHTSIDSVDSSGNGVICFYLNSDDTDSHKAIIKFIIENKLIKRTKSGKLTNIAFKLDKQTIDNQYGEKFNATIKLSDFIDLMTGEFIE